MAKSLYKSSFNGKLPLGGIASGHIDLGSNGTLSGAMSAAFAIKAECDGRLFDSRVLQSNENKSFSLPCFEASDAHSFFPFTEIRFSDSSCPYEVKLTSFSPFIPLNETDSGIPAVCFEFEVTNRHEERLDFSIACVSDNVNENAFNRMGCTDTGEAYIFLTGDGENSENTCIATNGKNVSFCEYINFGDGFIKNFTENSTLCNKTKAECCVPFAGGALCVHFGLNSGDTEKIKFCLSWYRSDNGISRNYYAQYFESGLEAASYFFRQMERLYGESEELCRNIFGATVDGGILEEVNRDLFDFAKRDYLRLDDGTLISDRDESFSDTESFLYRSDILSCLFPSLCHSKVKHLFKSGLYENANDTEKLFAIIKSYRRYILSGDEEELVENWYYVVKCMELVFGDDGKAHGKIDINLQNAAINAAAVMAEAVKDRKRHELYTSMLETLSVSQLSMDISSGFAKLYEISGFEYNAAEKSICFNPKSDICPLDFGNTFRCFFCTPQGYGYVEEGIDYIEINLLHGSLSLRSFGVPRIPRLVQYGGRNWRFENKNLTAVLDSDLEITPSKKLTIFIDIKQ